MLPLVIIGFAFVCYYWRKPGSMLLVLWVLATAMGNSLMKDSTGSSAFCDGVSGVGDIGGSCIALCCAHDGAAGTLADPLTMDWVLLWRSTRPIFISTCIYRNMVMFFARPCPARMAMMRHGAR